MIEAIDVIVDVVFPIWSMVLILWFLRNSKNSYQAGYNDAMDEMLNNND